MEPTSNKLVFFFLPSTSSAPILYKYTSYNRGPPERVIKVFVDGSHIGTPINWLHFLHDFFMINAPNCL